MLLMMSLTAASQGRFGCFIHSSRCCFPAGPLSLEYFTVSIIKTKQSCSEGFSRHSLHSQVLQRPGGRESGDTGTVSKCSVKWMLISWPSSLSLPPTENFRGFSAVVHPGPFVLGYKRGCVQSATKCKPLFPN